MRTPGLHEWKSLTPDNEVFWLKYSFGPGTANSLAAQLGDGSWMVISPPSDAPDEVYEFLRARGGVSALVAPNSFHNMGQTAWRERFPAARSYAATAAQPRLSGKTPGVDYLPVEALARQIEPAQLLLPEGMKTPDLLFRFPTRGGNIWWLGDQFSNNSKEDQILPLRILSGLVGSGMGYRANAKPEVVYVRDRPAWLDSIRDALTRCPPAIVVPAHGDPVTLDAAERTERAMDGIDIRMPSEKTLPGGAAYLLVGAVLGTTSAIGRLFRPSTDRPTETANRKS